MQVHRLLDILTPCSLVEKIFLVDNSEQQDSDYISMGGNKTTYIFNGENLGYGKAHNIALRMSQQADVKFHLVVNSDIFFDSAILRTMLDFMEANPDVGMLMPRVINPEGELQYLCKLLPTPLDLIGRRFLPDCLMEKRMRRFELRDSGYDHIMNVPYMSGCFMLLRMEAIRKVGMFDERFFLYPEDIDLTRRIHREYKTLYYPYVTIIHDHARGSYHSKQLLKIHMKNMCLYFNKYGWFCDPERNRVNKQVLNNKSQ